MPIKSISELRLRDCPVTGETEQAVRQVVDEAMAFHCVGDLAFALRFYFDQMRRHTETNWLTANGHLYHLLERIGRHRGSGPRLREAMLELALRRIWNFDRAQAA